MLTGNLSKPTLGKLLKSCQGIFQKKKGIKVNFRFHNKTYILFIFHIQININCKKCIIVVVLIFSQFKPMSVRKNLGMHLPWL